MDIDFLKYSSIKVKMGFDINIFSVNIIMEMTPKT